MSNLLNIKLGKISESKDALRTVNTETEAYLSLVDSIAVKGVLNPILVRPGQTKSEFVLVDGLHRYTAAKDAGLDTIPAQVMDLGECASLEAQIVANIHKVETKPVEFSQQIWRILQLKPFTTMTEMATNLARSSAWLSDRMKLLKLTPEIATLVDEGEINLSNAYALAKLPSSEQIDWVDRAISEEPKVFVPACGIRVKEIRDAARKGSKAKPAEFTPTARLQKLKVFKQEHETGEIGRRLCANQGIKDGPSGFALGVAWAIHLDPETVSKDEAVYSARIEAREKAKAERVKERAAKKAERAAKKAAELAELAS